jgi:plastocyanin
LAHRKLALVLLVGIAGAALSACLGTPPWIGHGQLIVSTSGESTQQSASILYLEPESQPRWTRWRAALVEVASDGASFRPALTAVHVGDEVRFANRGTVVHRVFTASAETRHERLVEPGGLSATLRISRTGENRFYCSLHSDESFVVFAAPSPFYRVLDGQPTAQIDRIPTGSYRLSSWSEAGVRFLGAIEIRSGEAASYRVSSTE